ncbi:MAG TPA: hypothetical protein PLE77_11900 [Kiritimatiellia bacterium]|nr:hypothetical protein [Kiritimatiellia bacterium]
MSHGESDEQARFASVTATLPGWTKATVLGVLLLNLVLLIVFAQRQSTSANTDSRLATIECLAHYGTFHIDRSRYVGTIDKVRLNGHFLSTKPPLLSSAAALAYRVFAECTGRTFANDEALSIYFVSVVTGVLPYMLLLVYFFLSLRLCIRRPAALALGMLAIGVGNLGLGYATGINNHVPGALAVMGAFYHAMRTRQPAAGVHHWMLVGLWAGLTPVLDIALAPFAIGFMIYLLAGNWRRTLLFSLPVFIIPLASHFVLNHAITGSFLPVYGRRELYNYPGSFWKPLLDAQGHVTPELLRKMGLEGMRDPKPLYVFNILLGHHGLFSMTPILLLGVWQAVRCVRKRCTRLPEALLVLAPSVILVGLIAMRSRNYGGVCVGLRWMVGVMPLFFLFTAVWLDRRFSRRSVAVFVMLTLLGSFNAWDALQDPWKHSRWEQLLRPAVLEPDASLSPAPQDGGQP